MSVSPKSTWPDRTSTIPTTALSRVLLPEPLGPTIDTISPGRTSIETPWMTGLRSYPAIRSTVRSEMPSTGRVPAGGPSGARLAASANKVGLHHLFLGPQRLHRPLGQHSAFRHDDDRVGELVHDRQ